MNKKFELIVIYIQSFMRMFLAKAQKIRLLQEKNSVVVQKYLRKMQAKKILFRLRSEAYDLYVLKRIKQI